MSWRKYSIAARIAYPRAPAGCYKCILRSRSALLITETELKVIAALAKMGLSSRPKNG
jgi:hypothetical protein